MYERIISEKLKKWNKQYSILAVVGPRQSGKSTVCRNTFPHHTYLNLEDPQTLSRVRADPNGEVLNRSQNLLIDEVQRWPELLSYLQVWTDEPNNKLNVIITGSNHLLMMEKISQTLAGRVALAQLLPLSQAELTNTKDPCIQNQTLEERIYIGGYPKLYNEKLDPQTWFGQYVASYVERDVRDLLNIRDLDTFQRFLGLCAGRSANLINESSLANDCGITHPTTKSWLSVLKAGYICFTLKPHHKNFAKRLVKQSKLYFYDTGLLCYLLGIQKPEQIRIHPLRGAIFENWVISEIFKSKFNQGLQPHFYFWRDQQGHEVDLIEDTGLALAPTEIKSSHSVLPEHFSGLDYFLKQQKKFLSPEIPLPTSQLVYAGDAFDQFKNHKVIPWSQWGA